MTKDTRADFKISLAQRSSWFSLHSRGIPSRSCALIRSGRAARLFADSHLDGAVLAVALHGHGDAIAGLALQNGLGDVAGGVDARRRCGR